MIRGAATHLLPSALVAALPREFRRITTALGLRMPETRPELAIARARVVLALALLTVEMGDPRAAASDRVEGVLAVYAAFAAAVWLVLRGTPVLSGRDCVGIHAVDVLVGAGLSAAGARDHAIGLALAFGAVAAGLRWRRGGVFWTCAATIVVMAVTGASELDLDRVPTALATVVVAGAIGVLSASGGRLFGERDKLAAWNPLTTGDLRAAVREALRLAADVLDVPRVMAVWELADEPTRLAWWTTTGFDLTVEPPGLSAAVVVDTLASRDFLCPDVSRPDAGVVSFDRLRTHRSRGSPVTPHFVRRFGLRAVLSVQMGGSGRLFFLDRPGLSVDELRLARIVAHHVMAVIEHGLFVERSGQIAATTERARIARDLHDGLVQSVTALALQLEASAKHVDEATRTVFERIQERLREEQARLRLFVATLQPASFVGTGADALADWLCQTAVRLGHDWRVTVQCSVERPTDLDAACVPLAQDLYFIVHEAISNAVRHGGASTVQLRLALEGRCLRITVTDDGRGFPFHGRDDEGELELRAGRPASLHARIRALGGRLSIASKPTGARLDIELPVGASR